jgi:flagellar basal-body rod protein FlgG
MIQSLYTAFAGMMSQQYNIDTIGNNIANINTTSFKGARVDFADALYQQMKKPIQSGTYLQQGSGMSVGAVQHNATAGVSEMTGNPADFMLNGPGYFTLQGANGQTFFTRDGSFKVSMENGKGYLVTAEGYSVLGADNKRIQIPGDANAVKADRAGNLTLDGKTFASLKITTFPNPSGLLNAGGNKYSYTVAAGAAAQGTGTTVQQGWLEGSNVDLAEEMSRLMRAQKAYSVLGTAIRTADEMESLANSMAK